MTVYLVSETTFMIIPSFLEKEGATPFPGLLDFTLDTYIILPSVKQGGIKYHFKRLWYDASWDWTQVFRTIGKRSTH